MDQLKLIVLASYRRTISWAAVQSFRTIHQQLKKLICIYFIFINITNECSSNSKKVDTKMAK
jgi:hypothetical protein